MRIGIRQRTGFWPRHFPAPNPIAESGGLIRHWLSIVVPCIVISCFPTPAFAQFSLPGSEPAAEPQLPEAQAPLEDIEAERARVEDNLQSASDQLREARKTLEPLQGSGQDTAPLERRVGLLSGRVQTARRHLSIIEDETSLQQEREDLRREIANWTGFPEPGPYPAALADKLFHQLKAARAARQTAETRLASIEYGKSLVFDAYGDAERSARQAMEALEAAPTGPKRAQARRDNELAQLELRFDGETVAYLRSAEKHLQERIAYQQARADFIRQKLATALADTRVSESEFEERKATLAAQLQDAREKRQALDPRQAELAARIESLHPDPAYRADPPAQPGEAGNTNQVKDPEPGPPGDGTGSATPGQPTGQEAELELRQRQMNVLRNTGDDINLEITYLQLRRDLWEERYRLQQEWQVARAKTLLQELPTFGKVIGDSISGLEQARAEVEDFALEPRFSVSALEPARYDLLASLEDRTQQLETTLVAARRLRDFLQLWQLELETRIGNATTAEEIRGWWDLMLQEALRIWDYELASVEDTLVVDGERVVEQRPITLGKVIQALLILAIGLLLASQISRLISRIVLPFSAGKWQNRLLLQRLLRIGLVLVVVALALITVKIPLTVFAFLGGAIAIGIGFGAQNLINNLISGFILLGEKPIRAGDQIEIEGVRGIVDKIGDRCTRVRRFDGVEILIPNSMLLENTVTNITLSDQRMRTSITVGVAYGSPTREVQELLESIARDHPLVVQVPEPVVVFEDFGDSALNFCIYFWLDLAAQPDFRTVLTDLRHTIVEAFAGRDIEIAFPQRDVHLDSGSPIAVQLLSRPD